MQTQRQAASRRGSARSTASRDPVNRFDTQSPEFSWRAANVRWPVSCPVGPGLAGAVADATRLSWIDPSRNTLTYRGVPIEQVARRYDLEDVAFLLIDGRRPEEVAMGRPFMDRNGDPLDASTFED